MKTKNELVKSWLDKAEKDMLSAEHELSFKDMVRETVCFHCQQAAEKYLKAYLVSVDVSFPKTHEIGELITKCEVIDAGFSTIKEKADILTDYAVGIRYPDDWYELTAKDVREAFVIAQMVRKMVIEKLKKKKTV